MQTTSGILPTLRKEKKKNSQHVLVMIRITVDGQRAEISVKRKVDLIGGTHMRMRKGKIKEGRLTQVSTRKKKND